MQSSRSCRDVFNAEQRMRKLKLASRSYHFKNDDPDFREICFGGPRASLHIPSESVGTSYGGETKRGSIYQSSKTITKMRNLGIPESRLLLWPESISETSNMSSISHREDTKPRDQQRQFLVNSSNMHQKTARVSRMNPNRSSKGSEVLHDTTTDSYQTCGNNLGSSSMRKVGSSEGGFLEVDFHPGETEHWHSITKLQHLEGVNKIKGRSLEKNATSRRDLQLAGEPIVHALTDKCESGVHEVEYIEIAVFDPEVGNLEGKGTSRRDEQIAMKSEKHNEVPDNGSVLNSSKSLGENHTVSNVICGLHKLESHGCSNDQTNPSRTILDPLMKSKSSHNQSPASTKTTKGSFPSIINKNSLLKKSLLKEFSKTEHAISSASEVPATFSPDHGLVLDFSPAHLHGLLKMTYKHGDPCFEFTLKDLESSFEAKACKRDSVFNWLYTFHSATSKRKSSGTRGRKDEYKESAIVGQMKVSSNVSSSMKNSGFVDTYIRTEFVLSDSTRSRESFESCKVGNHSPSKCCSQRVHKTSESAFSPGMVMRSPLQGHEKQGSVHPLNCDSPPHAERVDNGGNGSTHPCSWMPLDSQPQLQIAAMVVEAALGKDNLSETLGTASNQSANAVFDGNDGARMTVIIPSGIHGLSTNEEIGPSPILERWRSGGHCDCGGWDMACPVIVFDTHRTNNPTGSPLERNHQHFKLFLQGLKEKIPALTMSIIDKGLYSVDFHAQLSSLQVFAICVAVLHSSEISIPVGEKNVQQRLQGNSLKDLLEEDVKHFVGKSMPEVRRKTSKGMDVQTTFMLDPPISPIGRV